MATGKPKSMTTKWRDTGSRRSTVRCCSGWKLKIELKIVKSMLGLVGALVVVGSQLLGALSSCATAVKFSFIFCLQCQVGDYSNRELSKVEKMQKNDTFYRLLDTLFLHVFNYCYLMSTTGLLNFFFGRILIKLNFFEFLIPLHLPVRFKFILDHFLLFTIFIFYNLFKIWSVLKL